MAKIKKTNAMRTLDISNIDYNVYTYSSDDGKIDGISVANKVGKDVSVVFKTLVVKGHSKNIYVFVITVSDELDLKKVAKAVGEKSIEMIPVKEILKFTGYIRGGCSPIGMKKQYKTLIDKKACEKDNIIVSGGKIGIQIELSAIELKNLIGAEFADIIK